MKANISKYKLPICSSKVHSFPLSLHAQRSYARLASVETLISPVNSPRSVALVGQCHVARAQPVEAPEHRHGGADAVATLYPHQAGDHPVPVRGLQLSARRHHPDALGVARREPAHNIDLFEGELHGVEELWFARYVGRPELRPDDPLLQADQVGLPLRAPTAVTRQIFVEGEIIQLRAAAVLAQVPGEVVVPDVEDKEYS